MEDYQDANQDHMSMFKPVPMGSSMSPVNETVIRFTHITLPQKSPGPSENSSEVDESTAEFVTPQHINESTAVVESDVSNFVARLLRMVGVSNFVLLPFVKILSVTRIQK